MFNEKLEDNSDMNKQYTEHVYQHYLATQDAIKQIMALSSELGDSVTEFGLLITLSSNIFINVLLNIQDVKNKDPGLCLLYATKKLMKTIFKIAEGYGILSEDQLKKWDQLP